MFTQDLLRVWFVLFLWNLLSAFPLISAYSEDSLTLFEELFIVDQINNQLSDRFPVYYNNLLGAGYFNMPSARMGSDGEIGFGYSSTPPYRQYNLRFQCFDRLEIYGNYRIFSGVDDPVLSSTGYGEKSDKGANIKFALWHPEDSRYRLPGFAIGWEDFMGTKAFKSFYAVATQVFPQRNLEISLGYGSMRIHRWFGGASWMPWRAHLNPYLKEIAIALEYDATDYARVIHEPHPKARKVKSRFNYGVKYRLWDFCTLSLNYNKGRELAFSFAACYNLGQTTGLLPKIHDPLPCRAMKHVESLDITCGLEVIVERLRGPLCEQGFEFQGAHLSYDRRGRALLTLWMENDKWIFEADAKARLQTLLAAFIPETVAETIVIFTYNLLPVQEYRFYTSFLKLRQDNKIGAYELSVLHPLRNVTSHPVQSCSVLPPRFQFSLSPKTYTVFGSATGKFKWLCGLYLGCEGYLLRDWYYSVLIGVTMNSNLYDVKDVDRLNPSQIINVRTDSVNYAKKAHLTIDEAFLQKCWNLGHGKFTSLSCGLFEPAYGGLAGEFLYYPAESAWAIGCEAAVLKKRTYTGIGFTDSVRKLDDFRPHYKKFLGSQCFFNVYYDVRSLDLDLAFKAGKFLANDWGVRTEVSRYYPSGLRVYLWYTYTGAKDYVNSQRYHDHGAGISIPLDILRTYSSRQRCGYALSAWLRDVGAIAATGSPLYVQIRSERERR